MSDLLIIVFILLPVVIIIFLLSTLQKRQKKRKKEGYLKYLNEIKNETGISVGFQKQLFKQLVVLDEVNKKLLVIDRREKLYDYTLFNLNELKSFSIKHINETITLNGKDKKTETYTKQIGLEVVPTGNNQPNKLIVFFDHIEHNIMMKAEMEKEALQLQERLNSLVKKNAN